MTRSQYYQFSQKFGRPDGKGVIYTHNEKEVFHRDGLKLLKSLAIECGIEADFRSNKGGIAVSGEVTMHGDTVYVQLYQPSFASVGFQFLVRKCEGRKDYTGKTNHFHSDMDPIERLIALINNLK